MTSFVQLRTYDSYIEANLVLSFLQSENINCHLKDENTVLADPLLINAIGGIKLMVLVSEQNEAIELIEAFEKK